jgi:putative endopeptidase
MFFPLRLRLLAASLSLLLTGGVAAGELELRFDPASFDQSVEVCEDPYGYVNNRWHAEAVIPADQPMWGPRFAVILHNLERQRTLAERAAAAVLAGDALGAEALVGAFYAAGLDQQRIDAAGIAPIAAELDAVRRIRSRRALAHYLAKRSAEGLDLAFDYGVVPHSDDPERHMVYFEQGGLGLGDRAYYLDAGESPEARRKAYREYLARLFELAGASAEDAHRDAGAAFALESALAQASLSSGELAHTGRLFALRSLDEVGKLMPRLDLVGFLTAHGHRRVAEINLAQPEFFRALERQLSDTPLASWRAYLSARLLDSSAPYLAEPFAAAHAALHGGVLRGMRQRPPRWREVLTALDRLAPIPMSKLYVEAYLPEGAKQSALAMVADLRAAFRARIERAEWLSAAGRRAALAKLERMGAKIGYPDRWPSLAGLEFSAHDYFGNVRAAQRFDTARQNAKLDRPVDRDEWMSPAHEVNARYSWQSNEIIFPAPMIAPPVFDPALDPALNYATLGIIIGHELTHGFDDLGSRFDAEGRLREWWSETDRRRFDARGRAIIARYDGFEALPGERVNGRQTLSENTADLGGLAIAYDALMLADTRHARPEIDDLTQSQRFFLRYAHIWRNAMRPEFAQLRLKTDWHAPDRFRALGPIADMPEFALAFGCKPGDAMHVTARTRIGIW